MDAGRFEIDMPPQGMSSYAKAEERMSSMSQRDSFLNPIKGLQKKVEKSTTKTEIDSKSKITEQTYNMSKSRTNIQDSK